MKRSGFSLIELLAVITGLTVVLGGAVALMELMMGMNGDVRERTHTIATLGRLADQFRRDAHGARGEPYIARDKQAAEFDLSGGEAIRWGIDREGDLYRWETTDGVSRLRQNTYALPNGTTASLDVQKQGAARIVVLRIESPDAAGPSLAIEALAGRDAMPAEEEKK
jgi:hypothetical protein